jgi:hypothetical protein
MSGSVGSVKFKSGMVENVGEAVEIASLSLSVHNHFNFRFVSPPF